MEITGLFFCLLSVSHFGFYFSPKCVNYIFFSSPPHLYADPLSVLSAAAGRGRLEMCAFLLERGAGLEEANRRGMVPLLSATKHGHTQVRRFFSLPVLSSVFSIFSIIYFLDNFPHFPRLPSCYWSKVQTSTPLISRDALRWYWPPLRATQARLNSCCQRVSVSTFHSEIQGCLKCMYIWTGEQYFYCLWSQVLLCPLLIRRGWLHLAGPAWRARKVQCRFWWRQELTWTIQTDRGGLRLT